MHLPDEGNYQSDGTIVTFLEYMTNQLTNRIIPRTLDLSAKLALHSCFLFGPRMTGKSTLIRETLRDAVIFDLLSSDDFFPLIANPKSLENAILQDTEIVVIDEIQKAPQLLDEVHRLIETRKVRFLLTGSSARKLRRGGVNLLGGRAGTIHFHPLLARELGDDFNLGRALRYGTLPFVYMSEEPRQTLRNYVGTYLQEEIAAEGSVRNLPAFARFLDLAAHCNATIVNFANLASDAQVPRTTVHGYFEILRDTLILFELPALRQVSRRKPTVKSKYYFFDIGVATAIQKQGSHRLMQREGFSFETWLLHELRSWIDYSDRDEKLQYWKSQSGYEVDFLIGDHTAIEVKAKSHVGNRDLRSLRALMDEHSFKNHICVCLESRSLHREGIDILPFDVFLENLWEGAYR